mmetsp:Transcript_8568/g.25657  ORF Transcript_8568/g.25657 Transcript_8568/m.25657 type:complete len:263 (+) Transcript_8568:345-1133(+)
MEALLPIRGLVYVVQHRVYPARLLNRAAVCAAGSSVAVIALYTKGWSVQSAILSNFLGQTWVNFLATQTVLAAEASLTLYLVFRRLVSENGIFEAVLERRGVKPAPFTSAEISELKAKAEAIEAQRKQLRAQRGVPEKLLRFGLRQVGQRLLTAPLLLVPVVGWAAWLYANAESEGSSYHDGYFQKKGLRDPRMRAAIVERHQNQYRMFGAVVLLFNMVPVASFFLAFGNAAGAALWAADVEEAKTSWISQHAQPKSEVKYE